MTSIVCFLLFSFVCVPSVEARDVRVALLIAHQHGWKKDPFLRYVIQGDLLPLARQLKSIGFEVKTLQNPTPTQVKDALVWAQKRTHSKARPVDTFLFYYSGHADQKQLHLGPKTKHPVTYTHLVSFLRDLRVRRRVALLDACFSGELIREFGSIHAYSQLVRKGARGIRPLDLNKAFPNQGEQSGLQIMTSSLHTSWESQKYKSSVFTHFALEGLKGHADRNRDGKISVDELFDYVSDSMAKEINQKPLLFGVVQRSRSYALAPAYHSRLWINSDVVGTVRVSVGNFFWSRQKQVRRPIRLAVVHGVGHVEVQHKGSCRRQQINLPKGRMARLQNSQWRSIPCEKRMRVSKGMIELPSQLYVPPPRPRDWSISLRGSLVQALALRGNFAGGGQVGFWHRFGGIILDSYGTNLEFEDGNAPQLFVQLRLTGGYRFTFVKQLDWYMGAYVGGALFMQDLGRPGSVVGVLPQIGGLTTLTWWLSPEIGLDLQVDAGLWMGRFGGSFSPFFSWSAALGVRFLL
ncbi:MAG: caspase family protein [Myxococcales bacterium]|nr:caspase family protein [Myxococcales bacterium]MCB9641853.1 caspase family protein [Myxococcales bacterium]